MLKRSSEEQTKGFSHTDDPYLLLTFVPYYVDEEQRIWLKKIWHKDFVRHLLYLHDLTLVAPRHHLHSDNSGDLICLDQSNDLQGLRVVGLKPQTSLIKAVLGLPNTFSVLLREIKRAKIVHSGIVGWPFPLGWVANPIALFLKRKLVLVVESAPWRLVGEGPFKLKDRVRASVTERIGRFFMRRADLAIVTQPNYIESLRGERCRGIDFINPASWVDEEDIMSVDKASALWEEKAIAPGKKLKLLFAGRLVKKKGVDILLELVQSKEFQVQNVQIDVVGSGSMLGVCKRMENLVGADKFKVLEEVESGRPFLNLLHNYHAVIVPSLSDEQPRIIFDAFSQALPVIASDTEGNRSCVDRDVTGWLVPAASSQEVNRVISEILNSPSLARDRGISALKKAYGYTHMEMHRARSHVISKLT